MLCPDWNQEPTTRVAVIKTLYNPSIDENVTFPGPKGNIERLFQFTEEQRSFASKAKVAKNLDELKALVRALEEKDNLRFNKMYLAGQSA